ncbi:MAG: ABC transporter ATP-binding protein [Bacillota bacterium]|mgnify:CR=1 FL=1|jgi:branched-chain amino acid transport system ATP-binding protein|nr:ABC transporter ATP-binding protein [Bacillota bacterium]HOB90916.1 ABC transporter ATP-binding protein [Bacillota bacterium]HPZ54909.1 ABC transporter ATP-binding protein [Bacillota bacterium]HQD18049.1 ABC transporter ATP-binding protein [Bacillota bacterium]
MLRVEDLHVHYGGIHALKGIELAVGEGQIVALIGANGAGKSTTLNTISGLVRASGGRVEFLGKDITNAPSHEIVRMGLCQVPEGRKIFPEMTVIENLLMGAYIRNDSEEIKADRDLVFDLFPRLKERQHQVASTLSGGEQQMLAIGRGLMSRPKLLLLDEPSMGLAPLLVKEIFNIVKAINQQGTTILLVEQNANMALSIADYGYVLETGRTVLHGPAQELAANEEVKAAYLGG